MDTNIQARPQLIAKDGHLHTPTGNLLIYRYAAGDVDLINWPLPDEDRRMLASTLFDEREMGGIPGNANAVLLPDGSLFEHDLILATTTPYEHESYNNW
jgi:hypothetical protein